MPGNWDPAQNINSYTGRVEWPQGPLLGPGGKTYAQLGWTAKWVEAWVVQQSTGASQSTVQGRNSGWAPGRWTADGIPPGWINGTFQSGLALGIALVAYTDGTNDLNDWWISPIDLY